MSRILLLADAASTTGFARVSHAIGDRLVRDYGHEVHCLAVNYDGDAGKWDTAMKLYLPTLKRPKDVYGQSRFIEMLHDVMPDVVMMINDPYIVLKFLLRNKFDENLLLARSRPLIAYMPVDGYNQPANWNRIPQIVAGIPPVKGGTGCRIYPVTMTKFGQAFLGGDMIYHGVDHDRYKPLDPANPITLSNGMVVGTKAEARAVFGIPENAVMVLRVDRNSARKNYGDSWRALVPVMQRHKDMVAWFHCQAEGDQLELPQLVSRDPLTAERFFWPGQYNTRHGWPEENLIALYGAADIFLSTSAGEGFGLGIAEAAACGLPIVAQNIASIPEVVGPGGILLKPERLIAVDSGQDQWLPDVKKFTIAIERLYASKGLRESLGAAGRAHVVATFSWDEAAGKFDELISRVAQETPEIPATDPGDDDAETDDAGVDFSDE